MKKSLRTVITAAMFAAANMSALPTSAEGLNTEAGESPQYNWSEWGNYIGGDSGWNDAERITGQIGQMAYGPAPTYDLNDHSHDWSQNNWNFPYDEEDTVTTTMTGTVPPFLTTTTKATTTAPELLYGAPYVRRYIGDINMDGVIDGFDMIALRKLLIKGHGSSPASESYSDLNGDKKVNTADLVLLQRYLLGKIEELTGGTGYKGFMENVDVEKITSENQKENVTTTTASIYDPREDIVVSLYGIKPAKDIIDQSVFETKENIEIQLSSEDERE